MRLACVALLILVGTAFATRDFTVRAGRIAAWNDAIIVEMSSSSAEAEGKDLVTWWSIQQPPGTEQARIDRANTARPKLVRPAKSTIDKAALETLVDKARKWDWPELAREKTCPVRAKVGKKLVMLWLDKVSVSLGKSTVFESECESDVPLDVTRVHCFAHAGGYIVRVTLHHSCGGDQHTDRIGFIKP